MTRRFAAVIVNYNCAPLAIDAALSVIGAGRGSARVVIVDNASPDGSVECFRNFSAERRPWTPQRPPGARSVAFADPARLSVSIVAEGASAPHDDDLTIILARLNSGFAAGSNIGLKALDLGDHEFVLLLNPDALVAEGALDAFERRLADLSIGLCGATVLSFDPPHPAQAFGGAALDRWTFSGKNLGAGLMLADAPPTEEIERSLAYPLGAAFAFRPDYVDRAGYLDERYFLYYEEADWAFAGGALKVGWARDAVVYHRYGASTKSARSAAGAASRSPLSEFHMARSRLLFALKWRPLLAPASIALGAAQAARRLSEGRVAQARALALGSLPWAEPHMMRPSV